MHSYMELSATGGCARMQTRDACCGSLQRALWRIWPSNCARAWGVESFDLRNVFLSRQDLALSNLCRPTEDHGAAWLHSVSRPKLSKKRVKSLHLFIDGTQECDPRGSPAKRYRCTCRTGCVMLHHLRRGGWDVCLNAPNLCGEAFVSALPEVCGADRHAAAKERGAAAVLAARHLQFPSG